MSRRDIRLIESLGSIIAPAGKQAEPARVITCSGPIVAGSCGQGLRHAFEIGGYDMRPVEGIPPPKTEKSSDLCHYFSKMVQIHIENKTKK